MREAHVLCNQGGQVLFWLALRRPDFEGAGEGGRGKSNAQGRDDLIPVSDIQPANDGN